MRYPGRKYNTTLNDILTGGRTPLTRNLGNVILAYHVRTTPQCGNSNYGVCSIKLCPDFERNEEERISRANYIVIERPDANRKRRQILAYLTRHESMGRGSLNGAEPSEIHRGYFGKISPNLLWYHRADTSYKIGPGEEIKAFARLDRGARYNEIWTGKAQDLCRTIGFDVSRSCVSHVEKQLIAD